MPYRVKVEVSAPWPLGPRCLPYQRWSPGRVKGLLVRIGIKQAVVALTGLLLLIITVCPLSAQVITPRPFYRHPIPTWFFGMESHMTQPWPIIPFGSLRLWDTGTTWFDLNPSDGVYDWTTLDQWLAEAQQNNASVMLTIAMTPSWASSNPNDKRCHYAAGACDPPNDLNSDGTGPDQHWKDFVTAVATHAAGQIRNWEIWDEPNNYFYWEGTYAQMARMAGDAQAIISSIDPEARVTSPPVSPVDQNWWKKYAAAGGLQYADIIAFHGGVSSSCNHPPQASDLVHNVGLLTAILAEYNQQGKPLWDTEAQWGDVRKNCFTNPDLQAAFLGQFYMLHLSLKVRRFYWYSYADPYVGQLFNRSNGKLDVAGIAYQQVYDWLLGTAMTSECTAEGTIWTCGFAGPNGFLAEAIWDTAETCSQGKCQTTPYQVKKIYTEYRTLAGETYPIKKHQVPIGAEPILVQN